jgi:RNA polymerase sigma-70 factor (ECF subfamily)
VPAGDSLPELVSRARQGDAEAFGALVKQWKHRAMRTAYHLVGSWSDADDVAQDAFLRAYRGMPAFDMRAEFGTWLTRIVINCALNHLRSRRRARANLADREPAADTPANAADPRARAESREEVRALLDALAELAPPLRVTLLLATLEAMPYRDIAQALAVPEGTVAWRVNHARKLLRLRLAGLAPAGAKGNVDEVLRRTKEALGAP